ncbi:MAG: imidazole glycerol phosphate synthase subunit HisH [Bacteriovoracaceae bacterium]|nr:imidazole glycerol phosphate synthase subunit HisH [Bacteriovoracaceae bacterium]
MIGLIECGNGNIQSVGNALSFLNIEWGFISHKNDFSKFSHVILPGVGSFPHVMNRLIENDLVSEIEKYVRSGRPFLGICLGMQLLFEESSEYGSNEGLGLIKGTVKPLADRSQDLLVPHVGWNNCRNSKKSPFTLDESFYFTHSYYCHCSESEDVLGVSEYGQDFVSAVKKDNVVGFQFHPEKSQKTGLKLLNEFERLEC